MKVAIVTETFLPQVNGVVRTIEKITQHLEMHGHEVLIVTLGEGEDKYSKTKVVRIPGVKFCKYQELHLVKPEDEWMAKVIEQDLVQLPMAMLQSMVPSPHPQVEAAFKEFNPDIVHLATPATLGSIAYYYIEAMGLPCLSTFHTDIASYTHSYQLPLAEHIINFVTKLIYNRTDRVLAPSLSSKQQLESIGVAKVGVFGRGVNRDLFNAGRSNKEILKHYDLDPDKLTLLYVGRLAEEKSIPILITVFQDLLQDYNNIQLLIIGDGPIRASLEEKLEGTPHAFAGFRQQEALAELYASSDIFVFPSMTETFGQVVLEAMSSGLPLLGFVSPGVSDLVEHAKTGYLAPKNDIHAFKTYLEQLIRDKALREQFAVNAVEAAKKRSWTEILDALIEEYNILIRARVF